MSTRAGMWPWRLTRPAAAAGLDPGLLLAGCAAIPTDRPARDTALAARPDNPVRKEWSCCGRSPSRFNFFCYQR